MARPLPRVAAGGHLVLLATMFLIILVAAGPLLRYLCRLFGPRRLILLLDAINEQAGDPRSRAAPDATAHTETGKTDPA